MSTSTTKPPKAPTTIPSTSSLHPLATATGTHPLTLGPNTYIHLRATLTTTHAPITIGAHCIVGEKAVIGHLDLNNVKDEGEGEGEGEDEKGIVLEDHVIIEPKAVVEVGVSIGAGTVVGVGAKVGKGVRVGKSCKISPLCTVAAYEEIPDYTVVYGYDERRVDRSGMEAVRMKGVEHQVEVLRRAEFAARKK
ncbi:MAG: hypothetical protein Q9169_000221 [Polycauliona sp. 2 TL-2023]